jgi:GTPase SAR1 family protein
MDHNRDIILVTGQTGSGKTTWAKQAIRERFDRVICIDPHAQYQMDYMCFGDMAGLAIDGVPLSFFWGTDEIESFESVCDLAWAVGDCCLVLEEIDLYDQQYKTFKDIVFRGRHRKISVMIVTQRPYSCDIKLRSQLTELIAFQQTEKTDIKWLESISESAAIVPDLKRKNGVGAYFYRWQSSDGPGLHYLDYKRQEVTDLLHVDLSGVANRKNILEDVLKRCANNSS